jgi:hypothetical protein
VDPLRPEALTWTALLARWMEFAKASVAIPRGHDGPRWRASVPAVINLQAVAFALGDIARVDARDRPFARDQAAVIIRDAARDLARTWRGAAMPAGLREIVEDARTAHAASRYVGATELLWNGGAGGAEVLVMPEVPLDDATGTLAAMQPGTLVMPGEPVAWWVGRDGGPIASALPACAPHEPAVPRQVYRQLDDEGMIVGDVLAPVTADPEPGIPLLVPLFEDGAPIGRFTHEPGAWEERQRKAMREPTVPVREGGRTGGGPDDQRSAE